jgi:hypothetical protein
MVARVLLPFLSLAAAVKLPHDPHPRLHNRTLSAAKLKLERYRAQGRVELERQYVSKPFVLSVAPSRLPHA